MYFRAALLTDLDNTIYNWIDFFAPCFRAMVHVLARETGVDEHKITADFKRVFKKYKTVEYAFSIQELELCHGRSSQEVARLIHNAKIAFSMTREKNLKLYQDVKETLGWLRGEAIAIVAATNSPLWQARMRLRQLHVDHLFTGLAAWKGFDFPDDPYARPYKENWEQAGGPKKLPYEWEFEENDLKPSRRMYEVILGDLGIVPADTWAVGDSLQKDVKPALSIGAKGVWAEYGLQFNPRNFETLLSITHWTQERIENTYSKDIIEPSAVIQSFGELRTVIPPVQDSLFGPR